jgi:hypothetical protein
MEKVKKLGETIYSAAYNMSPNIKALPDDRHISNAANTVSQTPLIKDIYFKKFNPIERTYLQTDFIGDEKKINSTTNQIDKMALKGIRGLGQINTQYEKIKSTPGVNEQYELYKSNLGGKRKRKRIIKTRRKNTKRHRRTGTKRNIKKRR